MRFITLVILSLAFVVSAPARQQQYPQQITIKRTLVNRDIIQMVRAKVDDNTILDAIKTSRTNFDVSGAGIAALKTAGVSEAVLREMILITNKPEGQQPAPAVAAAKNDEPTASPKATPAETEFPSEIGVYYRKERHLIAIEPEIASWKTGGVAKKIATLGLDHGHIDGTVHKPHSALDLTSVEISGTVEFLIRCADGDSASEYQLIDFWVKSDRREFRTVTGGVLHASGGAQDNALDFSFEKVAPHCYRVLLTSLRPGEYGFLAPSTTASVNAPMQGKAYTFRIVE